jgi:hypothetical protein
MADNYRCERCLGEPERCTDCRARRAAARQERRAAKRRQGLCIDCHRQAEIDRRTGKRRARCRVHRALNNRISAAGHARRRRRLKVER